MVVAKRLLRVATGPLGAVACILGRFETAPKLTETQSKLTETQPKTSKPRLYKTSIAENKGVSRKFKKIQGLSGVNHKDIRPGVPPTNPLTLGERHGINSRTHEAFG